MIRTYGFTEVNYGKNWRRGKRVKGLKVDFSDHDNFFYGGKLTRKKHDQNIDYKRKKYDRY